MFLNGNISSGIFLVKINVNGFLSKVSVTEHFHPCTVTKMGFKNVAAGRINGVTGLPR